MRALLVLVAASTRARRRALVAVVVLVAVTGGVALASLAGSRRGRDALDRFLAENRPGTLEAFVNPAIPRPEQDALVRRMVRAGDDPSLAAYSAVVVALPDGSGALGERPDVFVASAPLDGRYLARVVRPMVLSGALPLDPGEVAVNEHLAERRRVAVGDTIELALFAAADLEAIGNGRVPRPAVRERARVGAVIRQPKDLARSAQAQPGTLFELEQATLVFHPGLWAEHGLDVATYGVGLVGDPPTVRYAAVVEALREAGGENGFVNPGPPDDLARLDPVAAAIDLESNALVAFAALVALVGFALLGPAVRRVTGDDVSDRDVYVAVGFTPRALLGAALLRGALVGVVAAVLAVGVATALSAAFPIGLAADGEVDRGARFDGLVLPAGAVVLVLAVVARAALTARRRTASALGAARAGRPVRALAPAPPAIAAGARLALSGAARDRRTARAAVVTAVAGVAAVVGAATYAASYDRLTGRPALHGWRWDVVVGNFSVAESAEVAKGTLAANRDVEWFAGFTWATLDVDGRTVPLLETTEEPSRLDLHVLEGRLPATGEIAVGRGTLADLGKRIGDEVAITAQGAPVRARIVGTVVTPAVVVSPMDLDSGGVVTAGTTARVYGEGTGSHPSAYIVRLRDDVERGAALQRLRRDFPGTVLGPMLPNDLRDLGRVSGLPNLLAAMLGALACGSVALTVGSMARRRRRELAVLRTVGFDRRQVRVLVASQASTYLVVAAAVGVPLGVVVGTQAWGAAADSVGTEVGVSIPLLRLVVSTAAVAVVLNAAAQLVAGRLARRRPGADLRAE